MTRTRILLVEDDHLQRKDARRAIEAKVEGASVETLGSEAEFVQAFERIAEDPPDVFVLDMMLRWGSRETAPPSREITDKPQDAGLRCAKRLLGDDRTRGAKIIVFSILGEGDLESTLPQEVVGLVKEAEFDNLIEEIRNSLPLR